MRSFGSGGLFASIGYFSNQVLGNYLAYITDPQNAVVVEFTNRLVVVTPKTQMGYRKPCWPNTAGFTSEVEYAN